jgi:MFS transporter, ACDE family, multidrug resistance protein
MAGRMVDHWNLHVPFLVGALTVLAGVAVLSTSHRMLSRADAAMAADHHGDADDVAGEMADEFGGAPDAIDYEREVERSSRS